MSNCVYVQFQKVENFNVEGNSLTSYWQVNVWDDYTTHTFSYEDFKDIKEEWTADKVIDNLKTFDVLDDFVDTLERKKGFYYPSTTLLSNWVDIEMKGEI